MRTSFNMKKVNVIGKKFGKLIVLQELEPHINSDGSKTRIVKVKCKCGNTFSITLKNAKKAYKCAKCKNQERRINLIGKRFGKLIVIDNAEDYITPKGVHIRRLKCKCDCGNIKITSYNSLHGGYTKSCGCLSNTCGLLKDFPKLMEKYDYINNKDVNLKSLTARSSKQIYWKCPKCKGSYLAVIASQWDHDCPYCAHYKPYKGKTDLLTKFPKIVNLYWDYKRNKIRPDEISAFSNKTVFWQCSEGHPTWRAKVESLTKSGTRCPYCNKENQESFVEEAVYYYIKNAFKDAIHTDKHIGMELDIYIPSKKVGIEYDGEPWHVTKRKIKLDNRKNLLCQKNGILLIRIREPKLPPVKNCISFIRKDSVRLQSLTCTIKQVLRYLGKDDSKVNVEHDEQTIYSQLAQKKFQNSLLSNFPDVTKEWNFEKNGNLTPEKVSKASNRRVWWKCSAGHEWRERVSERTRPNKNGHSATGCPYCSSRRVLKGFNDLMTIRPDIAKEWDYIDNGSLKPSNVMSKSSKKVWWIGKCGHKWQSKIYDRTRSTKKDSKGRVKKATGCPYCSNHKVLAGFNDLATKRPDIVKFWNYEKNNNLKPSEVLPGSHKKVWWTDNIGNEWFREIRSECNYPKCFEIRKQKNPV